MNQPEVTKHNADRTSCNGCDECRDLDTAFAGCICECHIPLDKNVTPNAPEATLECPNGTHCVEHTFETLYENDGRKEIATGRGCVDCDVYIDDPDSMEQKCEATGKVVPA